MTWKCSKCAYKTTQYNVLRKHYKDNHGTASRTKGNQAKVYIYRPPKGRPGFGKRRK